MNYYFYYYKKMEINKQEPKDYPKLIFYETEKKILKQMANKICIININDKKGTGFFTKIPVDDKLIPVLITSSKVINKNYLDSKNEITVYLYYYKPKVIKLKEKVI